MEFALILVPLCVAAIAASVPSNRMRPWLLPVASVAHLVLTVLLLMHPEWTAASPWLKLDPLGRIILPMVSALFLACSFYSVGVLHYRHAQINRVFCVCLISFLSVMTLVVLSQHLGLMWVAIETLTLVTAPLIYFNRTPQSIEATWKYLLIGSVGIALALLGTFFLAYASLYQGIEPTLAFDDLLRNAPGLSKSWLHAAFVLLLVGYGTKMGLAPMHTWKPDAYGEAPGVVGAVFAGGVTSCAFLALLRVYHICEVAGEGAYISRLLLLMGFLSMTVAGLFMVGQKDFKRMLAYSSVEHMGILAIGLGIGGPALFGTLLHVVTNGLTKGVLFLSAGNIHRAYASKSTDQVGGAIRRLPISGAMFLAGFLAITGSPPFGPFISEFSILSGAFDAGRFATGGFLLLLLLVVFIGMGSTVLQVVQGRAPASAQFTPYREDMLTTAPVIVLMASVLALGLFIPSTLITALNDAVHFLKGRP